MADMHDNQADEAALSGEGKPVSGSFIKIKSLPRIAYGRDLRLREGDIILAVETALWFDDVALFDKACKQADETGASLLVTIGRGEVVFDILVERPLRLEFDYTTDGETNVARALFATHEFGSREDYRNYEALRDVYRHVVLYDTAYSGLATMLPPAWLLQHRAWEPLAATVAVYVASAAISWYLFIVSVLLLAFYYHRIQHRLIRNYSIFTEHYFWLVCAARSTAEAQMICRKLDPKARFDFSYVGPPEPNDTTPRQAVTKTAAPKTSG